MNQLLLTIRWALILELFGLAALPLGLRLFRRLPDRGYSATKALGLLLVGWVFWLLTTFGWLQNTAGGALVSAAIVLFGGLALTVRSHSSDRLSFPSWRVILVTEAVFLLGFAGWAWVRAQMPRIEPAGGEKWMEIAFLRAILRSDSFPPHDPWLSGFAISYYYFGYVIMAMVTRLTAVPPAIAFNLGIASLFALACTGVFGLVYNLVEVAGKKLHSRAVLGGLLAIVLLVLMGNLYGFLEMLHGQGLGPIGFWTWLDIPNINHPPPPQGGQTSLVPQRYFWWWQASRVVQDFSLTGERQTVIDEFPSFSFLLGDMHPHVLGLPFVLLAIALALALYRRVEAGDGGWTLALFGQAFEFPLPPWAIFVFAVGLGGLGFLNTWDFPIYLFVTLAALVLALWRRGEGVLGEQAPSILMFGSALLVLSVLLYLPFWIGFQSQAGGLLPNLFNGTRLAHFLVMFAPLLFIAAAFVVERAIDAGVEWRRWLLWSALTLLAIVVVGALLVGGLFILARSSVLPAHGTLRYVVAWAQGESIPGVNGGSGQGVVVQRLLDRLTSPWTSVALILLLALTLLTVLRRRESERGGPAARPDFVLLLFATGALLALSVEFVYLRDNFGTRMNTVFKFYFQTWILWSVAGAYALTKLLRRVPVASLVAVLLIALGLIYPALAIPSRAAEQGAAVTLDGSAYLADARPADYAAIQWLNRNVAGAPVILETPGGGYEYEARVSAHTGLPTVLGWAGHEHQWRGSYEEQAARERDIEQMYNSTDGQETLPLLEKYDVRYVYVGPVERAQYSAEGLEKFSDLLDVVYQTQNVTIYER